jgi:branched-chain amino acid transport system permease protein
MTNIFSEGLKVDWRYSLKVGLISGIVLLYLGMVGMIGAFVEREVIYEVLSMAQLMLILIPFVAAFLVTKRMHEQNVGTGWILLAVVATSLLGLLPTIVVARLAPEWNIASILVKLDRDWLQAISFGSDDFWQGIGLLIAMSAGTSLLGAALRLIPDKPRGAILTGMILALAVVIFGETLRLILQETMPDPVLDFIFRRSVVRPTPAVLAFVIFIGISLIWTYFGKGIRPAEGEKVKSTRPERTPMQRLFGLLLLVVLLLLPFLIGRAISDVMVLVGIYVLMGFGLNIAIGLAGLLDLGYVTTFAVGAYVMGILTSTGTLGLTDGAVNFWIALPIAMLAAMFAGFIFAVPVLKMRGDYLAIATLGFGEIIGKLAVSDWLAPIIGGAQGLLAIPKPVVSLYSLTGGQTGLWLSLIIPLLIGLLAVFLWRYTEIAAWKFPARVGLIVLLIFGSGLILTLLGRFAFTPTIFSLPLQAPEQLYYIVLAACALTLFVSVRLNNSRIGRQWMAIREDEDVAAAMGIDTARSKLLAFTLSAATGGIAGGIFAAKVGTVFPNSFLVFVSINVLALIIVGGMGNNTGIVLGALILVGMPELLREFSEFRFLLYGLLLIFMMLNRPEGFLPSQLTRRELHRDTEPEPAPAGKS